MPGSGLDSNAPRKIPLYLAVGTLDSLLSCAQETAASLQNLGHPVTYKELAGKGHGGFFVELTTEIWSFLSAYSL